MNTRKLNWAVLILGLWAGVAGAQSRPSIFDPAKPKTAEQLASENASLRAEIDKLRAEIAELKRARGGVGLAPQPVAPATDARSESVRVQPFPFPVGTTRPNVENWLREKGWTMGSAGENDKGELMQFISRHEGAYTHSSMVVYFKKNGQWCYDRRGGETRKLTGVKIATPTAPAKKKPVQAVTDFVIPHDTSKDRAVQFLTGEGWTLKRESMDYEKGDLSQTWTQSDESGLTVDREIFFAKRGDEWVFARMGNAVRTKRMVK